MTEKQESEMSFGDERVSIPPTPKVCFTELKLSESRIHAKRYGRLGIGVKRRFLFDRSGRPLLYYWYKGWEENDPFLKACAKELQSKDLLNFFKPMDSRITQTLTYDLYRESEWRIIYFKELLERNGSRIREAVTIPKNMSTLTLSRPKNAANLDILFRWMVGLP
jgi:hypothetical protein